MATRQQVNSTLSNILKPVFRLQDHSLANKTILDYLDQEIVGVKDLVNDVDFSNYYTKQQVSVLVSGFTSDGIAVDESLFSISSTSLGSQASSHSVSLGLNSGSMPNAFCTNFIGSFAGYNATNAQFSNFIGNNAGTAATGATRSNFIGDYAGANARNADNSVFLGTSAGENAYNAFSSVFLGELAGSEAAMAAVSVMVGDHSGVGAVNAAQSVFAGHYSGYGAVDASTSIFLGANAGRGAEGAANSIFIGENTGREDLLATGKTFNGNSDYSILIGNRLRTGGFKSSVLMGGSTGFTQNTRNNQFMLTDNIINARFRGVEYVLPGSQGSAGTVLTNDGSGNLSWVESSGGSGGGEGSVTYVALATGTSGTDVNVTGSPITTSGTFTLNIPNASATARGVISTGAQTIAGDKTFSGTTVLSAFRTNSTSTNSNLAVPTFGSISNTNDGSFVLDGASTVGFRAGIRGSNTSTLTANSSYASLLIGANGYTEAGSGSHPLVANLALRGLNATNGVGTTTNAATLYIDGVLTGITPTNGNYSIWSRTGANRFGGSLLLDSLAGSGTRMVVANAAGELSTQTIPSISVNVPLYLEAGVITLNRADENNDGYLSADDYSYFLTSAGLWQQLNTGGGIPAVNPVFRPILASGGIYFNQGSSIYESLSGEDRAYMNICGASFQSVAIGSRGLAQRITANLWTPSGIGQSVAIGEYALAQVTTGIENTAVGKAAGYTLTSGSRNVIVGSNRSHITTGNDNTLLGRGTSSFPTITGDFNIAIGSGVLPMNTSASNQLNIGNWIYGVGGSIGINKSAPTARFEVASSSSEDIAKFYAGTTEHVTIKSNGTVQLNTVPTAVISGNPVLVLEGGVIKQTTLGSSGSGSNVSTISASTTLSSDQKIVFADASAGNIVVTLPAASANVGKEYMIKKTDSSANTVSYTTVERTTTISTQYAGNLLVSDGSSWFIMGVF
ncbi:MAG: hypothetical protein ABW007_21355 [Chitinophagaceae bacterium]